MPKPVGRPGSPAPGGEAGLVARWLAGMTRPLRLEDGRSLRVTFPGRPGEGAGPDVAGAIIEAGGDVLRGPVEVHLFASGWEQHRHHLDPAYDGVVLHVVGRNDSGAVATVTRSGRAVPILVLPAAELSYPPPFTPPCVLPAKRRDPRPALERMGERRLRQKAARAAPLVAADGPGQALYTLLLEYLAGRANRGAFAATARALPLEALLERARGRPERARVITAELKGAAAAFALRRAGLRPMAAPGKRLEAAGDLVHRLWPDGSGPAWPGLDCRTPAGLIRALRAPGIGRAAALELAVNAVLPAGLAAGEIAEEDARGLLLGLRSPGTYGRLRQLEGWLGGAAFAGAAALQGGLLLQDDYCLRGRCGRCPLSWPEGGST